jgi:ubiquinone/menaquinone biosynthesis C-methylase UbiE
MKKQVKKKGRSQKVKMYTELASWWPLISSPADYKEEAGIFSNILKSNCKPCKKVLELGSGGGNNASHMKKHFHLTLVDRASGMLKNSRKLNPECEHILGDMRTVRLNRVFDAVFIHDAIMYLTTRQDLEQAFYTAYMHLRKNGCVLVVPDFFKEHFKSSTKCHGHDKSKKGIRYLEWNFDPDARDTTCECHFAYLIKYADGRVKIVHDRHIMGIFPKATWLKLLKKVGFKVKVVPCDHSELEPNTYFGLLGKK